MHATSVHATSIRPHCYPAPSPYQFLTDAENKGYKFALMQTMDLWYAHQRTVVFMCTKPPPTVQEDGTVVTRSFDASGWTTYERCCAEQIKGYYMYDARWKLCVDLGKEEGEEYHRR